MKGSERPGGTRPTFDWIDAEAVDQIDGVTADGARRRRLGPPTQAAGIFIGREAARGKSGTCMFLCMLKDGDGRSPG